MSLEGNSGTPLSVGLLLRDLPKIIWALVLLIGGLAYIAMKALRSQWRGRTAGTTSTVAENER